MFVMAPKVLGRVKPEQFVELSEFLLSENGSHEAFCVEVHVETT